MGTKRKEMTLVAAAKPQLKKRAKRDWSKAKAERFLSVLGETCNVSEACRRSKVPMTVAYRRRKMDAAFRAEWGQTIADAYRRLELVLLERAFNGTEKIIRRRDGSEERMRQYSDALALRLLQMHRQAAIEAEAEFEPEDVTEIRARLVRKLQRMKTRDEQTETGPQRLRGASARESDPEKRQSGGPASNYR